MTECIFCKIINNELPSAKVYEDNEVVAFLDIQPVKPGHTLVVPKKHSTSFESTDTETVKSLFAAVHKISMAVKAATEAQGFNLSLNNGRAAGQVIDHTHIHIIPRFDNDGLKPWQTVKYENSQMSDLAAGIKAKLEN